MQLFALLDSSFPINIVGFFGLIFDFKEHFSLLHLDNLFLMVKLFQEADRRQIYREDVQTKIPPPPAPVFDDNPNIGTDDESAWFVDKNKEQINEGGASEGDDFTQLVKEIFGNDYEEQNSYKPNYKPNLYEDSYEKKPYKEDLYDGQYVKNRPYNEYNLINSQEEYKSEYNESPYHPKRPYDGYKEIDSQEQYRPTYENEPYRPDEVKSYEPSYDSKPYRPEDEKSYQPSYNDKPYEDSYEDQPVYQEKPYKVVYEEPKPYKPDYKPTYTEKPFDSYIDPYQTPYDQLKYTPAFKEPVLLKPSAALSPAEHQKEDYHHIHQQHGYKAQYKTNSIPGKAGDDYPDYTAIPKTNYVCPYDKSYGDKVRFADPETRCQVSLKQA